MSLSDHGTSDHCTLDHRTPNLVWPIAHNKFMCKIRGLIENVMGGSRGGAGAGGGRGSQVAISFLRNSGKTPLEKRLEKQLDPLLL